MRIRALFISLFLFFLLIIDIIHSTLISNALNEQLSRIEKSGLGIDVIKEHSSFLIDSKSFNLRLNKVDQLTQHLFGLDPKDPLTISLAKFEGTSFKVELVHYKYIFSNYTHIRLALNELPVEFTANSTFLTNLVNFFQTNINILKIDFNLWSKEFRLHVDHLDHMITADRNVSYHAYVDDLEVNGLVIENDQYHLWGTTKQCNLSMIHNDQTIADFTSKGLSLALQRSPELWQVDFSVGLLDLLLNLETPSHITLKNLSTTQNRTIGETISIYSKLDLSEVRYENEPFDYQVHHFSYDISLDNLNQKVLDKMSLLIDDSNTNPVTFIFEDLEKNLDELLKYKASLRVKHLKFDNLILDSTDYQGVDIQLFTQSKPDLKPYKAEFDLYLTVSPILYKHFKEKVVNADLTQGYVDNEDDKLKFHLELTPEGFELNGHLLNTEGVTVEHEDDIPIADANVSVDEVIEKLENDENSH